MKTSFAIEKSEYLHYLCDVIDMKLPLSTRMLSYTRMQEIEKEMKKKGNPITIIISTNPGMKTLSVAPPMTKKNIKKNKSLY